MKHRAGLPGIQLKGAITSDNAEKPIAFANGSGFPSDAIPITAFTIRMALF